MARADRTAGRGYSLPAGPMTFLALALLSGAACSSGSSGTGEDGSTIGSGASASGNGDGVGGQGAGAGAGLGSGASFGMAGGSAAGEGTGADGGFDECVGDVSAAEGVPLDMFVVLDHTASMGSDCPLDLENGPSVNSMWCFATHALARYFTSDAAQGHRAALQFMALPGFLCEGGPDNPQAQAAVDLTPLPVDASHPLIVTLDEDDPSGGLGTPIEAALRGITEYTAANEEPGRTMIGILITDGDANRCSEDYEAMGGIVRDHLEATGIRTFLIGMTGATLANLETIARQGGAPEHSEFCGPGVDSCHYWDVGDGEPEAFVSALEQISALALISCEYTIPSPPPGERLDLDLVNVTFTDAEAGDTTLPRVDAASDCGADGGWYYDDPVDPSTIGLCPATCSAVEAADLGSRVHVAYGCDTVLRIR